MMNTILLFLAYLVTIFIDTAIEKHKELHSYMTNLEKNNASYTLEQVMTVY